jgi:hypothetical protein
MLNKVSSIIVSTRNLLSNIYLIKIAYMLLKLAIFYDVFFHKQREFVNQNSKHLFDDFFC